MSEALSAGLHELGEFVASLDWHATSQDVLERLLLTLFDTIGVTVAGALTPEMRRLADVHAPRPGPAGAIDAACGLALATPFESALAGSFVRNTWIGAANRHGIEAARLAAADLAGADGTARASLGKILGAFDEAELTEELGSRFDVTLGYFKRHASCSYTHPPADAALEIRGRRPELEPAEVSSISVETHALAASLDRSDYPTRLAAMFSIPYVTAVALVTGDCSPARFDATSADAALRELVAHTAVTRSDELDGRLPGQRAARVTIRLADGSQLDAEVSNPVGDADHHPFGVAEVRAKLESLLAPHEIDVGALWGLVTEFPSGGDSAEILQQVP